MAEAELMEHMTQRFKEKAAAYRAEPVNLTREPEPVETIAEMHRDLETLDNDALLFLAEESPTCREILLRRMLGLTPASSADHLDRSANG